MSWFDFNEWRDFICLVQKLFETLVSTSTQLLSFSLVMLNARRHMQSKEVMIFLRLSLEQLVQTDLVDATKDPVDTSMTQ